jgi:hypothetical protein
MIQIDHWEEVSVEARRKVKVRRSLERRWCKCKVKYKIDLQVTVWESGFDGLEVACWSLVPKFAGLYPAEAVGFLGRNNSHHAFLWRGIKAIGLMS